ncbi:MAG TPA: tetratricopeptide repeat protein, partial [Candidatus Poseidoniaceae archaeon]
KIMEDAFDNVPGAKEHPALCHLYCHALELSPYPEKALPAADVLRTLMPGCGHLVHMPSHIDAWVGQWKEAIDCNIAAVEADDKYVELTGNESQFYKFYRMHNHHFVVWCAMFDGQYETALKYARKAVDTLPAGDANHGAQFMLAGIIPMGAIFLESYVTMPWHVMIRFGKWDEILAEPMYSDRDVFPATIATQHYARGVAYASKGMVPEAEAEQALFQEALQNPALAGRMMHNNFMYQDPAEGPSILNVNAAILEAEIEYRRQFLAKAAGEPHDFTAAFDELRRGVDLSLNLAYNEPWGQMQPVRHILGALLFEQGHIEEAEEVYRADIKLWKDNMWGLLGLKLCLEARGDAPDELAAVTALFNERSSRADIVPAKTCFCAQDALEKSCCD